MRSARCCSGLYDDAGVLQHVGVTSSFTMEMRRDWRGTRALAQERAGGPSLARLGRCRGRRRAAHARRAKPLERRQGPGWEPLRPERVCEVKYDHLQGDRFRHAAVFLRWRPDKPPEDCRYDQLEVATPFELAKVFKGKA